MTKMDLATDAEVARVRAAYLAAGPHHPERLADDKASRQREALINLGDAWGKLSDEERATVSFELARLVSPPVDPHELDVGVAIYRALIAGAEDRVIEPDRAARSFGKQLLAKRSRGVREPGFREAVLEAGNVWMERDNAHTWNPGNIHRDDSHYALTPGWQPSPMLAFVAFTVTRAVPVDVLRRAADVNAVKWPNILKAVATHLRTKPDYPQETDPV